jgi:hypothetical protein
MLKDKKCSVLLSSFMLAVLFLAASGCQQCKKRPERNLAVSLLAVEGMLLELYNPLQSLLGAQKMGLALLC